MKVLGFKKWYESKLENNQISLRVASLETVGDHIYKFPKRMLQLEMEILGESSLGKKSKNPIVRYLISNTNNPDRISGDLRSIIKEGKSNGRFFYLLGYDFTSSDPKKCYKNSLKIAETLKNSLEFLNDIPVRGMGRIEQVHENYHSQIPGNLLKQRVELVECFFDPQEVSSDLEIPFYFNPNDYTLLEKYEGCLRGILIQSILFRENFQIEIAAAKSWPSSKKIKLTEGIKEEEDLKIINEMKYKDPRKSSLVFPENKPLITNNKVSVKEITEKRSESVIKYLSSLTLGMPIEYIKNGLGYKEGNQTLKISIK